MKHRKLTQAELIAEAKARFGDDFRKWAFRCPSCRDVATPQDFFDSKADANKIGQECIGRSLGALSKKNGGQWTGRGCDWAAYGLFRGPWEIVMPAEGERPERSVWSFPLAEQVTAGGVA